MTASQALAERIVTDVRQPTPLIATEPSTWDPVDLGPHVDGTARSVLPTVGRRDDGVRLFYRGRTSTVYGGSESGKSLLLQSVVCQEIANGDTVLYVDFEDTEDSVVQRLKAIGGASVDGVIADRVIYVRPAEPISTPGARVRLKALLDLHRPSMVVLDGVTEAMVLHGLELKDNTDVASFLDILPRSIARHRPPDAEPAAVVLIDHVTHASKGDPDADPVGGIVKRTGLDGTSILVINKAPFVIGGTARSLLYVRKDRVGQVQRHCKRSESGRDLLATKVVDSHSEWDMDVYLYPPGAAPDDQQRDPAAPWKPTKLMGDIYEVVADNPDGISGNGIRDRVRGRKDWVGKAVAALVDDGHITPTPHKPLRPYPEPAVPSSQPVPERSPEPGQGPVPVVPPLYKGTRNRNYPDGPEQIELPGTTNKEDDR